MTSMILAASSSVGELSVAVGAAILGSGLLSGLVATILNGRRASAAERRDKYAAAVEAVVAWAEYPYRVRRRVDDDPQTLSKLADLGHDLQERLARHQAWVSAESSPVSHELNTVIDDARKRVSDSITEAWDAAPVTCAVGMNVSPFGPGEMASVFGRLDSAVRWRFGWRRVLPGRFVRWRLSTRQRATPRR